MSNRQQAETELITRAQQDPDFRQRLISDPKGVAAREFGVMIPDNVAVEVLEESPSNVYLVLPPQEPQAGSMLSDTDLESVSGGWFSSPGQPASQVGGNPVC